MQLNCPHCSSTEARFKKVAGLLGALMHWFAFSVWECDRCQHQYVVFGAVPRRRGASQA